MSLSEQKKRRIIRRTRRVLIGLSIAALILWLLPAFIPRSYLRRVLRDAIARNFEGEVKLDDVTVGWLTGFCVSGLSIDDRENTGTCVHVKQLQIPLEPLRLAFTHSVSSVRLDGVSIEFKNSGKEFVLPLVPSGDRAAVVPRRIQLVDAQVIVEWPGPASTTVKLPWLEVELDLAASSAEWQGHGWVGYLPQPLDRIRLASRVNSSGKFNAVEQGGQTCYSGKIHLAWRDLELEALRLDQIPDLQLAGLGGQSSGNLSFEIFPDFHFQWSIDTELEHLTISHRGADATRIERLGLSVSGQYDPITGRFDLAGLNVKGPSVELASQVRGRFEPSGLFLTNVSLAGTIDTRLIISYVPWLSERLRGPDQISGRCRLEANWQRDQISEQMSMKLIADETKIAVDQLVNKPAGSSLGLSISLRADQTNWPWMDVKAFSFVLGQVRLSAQGRIPRLRNEDTIEEWIDEVKHLADIAFIIEADQTEQIAKVIPPFVRWLELAQVEIKGAAQIGVDYNGGGDQARVHAKLSLPDETVVAVADDLWVKPSGRKTDLDLAGSWSWSEPIPQIEFVCKLSGQPGVIETDRHGRPARVAWSFHQSNKDEIQADIALDVPVSIEDTDRLVEYSPRVAGELQARHWQLAGDADLGLQGAVRLVWGENGWKIDLARLRLSADTDRAQIDLNGRFVKARGTSLNSSVDLLLADKGEMRVNWQLIWQQLDSMLSIYQPPGPGSEVVGEYRFKVDEIGEIGSAIPELKEHWLSEFQLAGGMSGAFHWREGPDKADGKEGDVSWQIDMTRLSVKGGDQELKAPGVECSLTGAVHLAEREPGMEEYTISALSARHGDDFLKFEPSYLRLHKVPVSRWLKWAERLGVEPWLAWQYAPIETMDFHIRGRLALDSRLCTLNERLARWCAASRAEGSVDVSAEVHLADGVLGTRIEADMGKLAFEYPNLLAKAGGMPSSAVIQTECWPGDEKGRYYCQIDPLLVQIGPLALTANGYSEINWPGGAAIEPAEGQLHVEIQPTDMQKMRAISEPLRRLALAGRSGGTIHFVWKDGRLGLGPSHLMFDHVTGRVADFPLLVNGGLDFSSDYLSWDDLSLQAGRSQMTSQCRLVTNAKDVAGDLGDLAVFGSVFVDCERFDSDQLAQIKEKAAQIILPESTQALATSSAVAARPLGPEELTPLRKILANSELTIGVNAKNLLITKPDSEAVYQVDKFVSRAKVGRDAGGRPTSTINYRGQVYDGEASGQYVVYLDEPNPSIVQKQNLLNLKVNSTLQPLIEDFFPGMIVNDTLTIIEESKNKMFSLPELGGNFPQGQGEMVFADGYLIGKAAPDWLTNIFPGLNFTKYSFSRMHNWFTRDAEGTTQNNMIFRGIWNIYVEGVSRADHTVKYEVGVDLLARFESEYWSSVGQGRVPIFTTTGRIVGRKFVDQEIRYVPPHEVLYRVFVKNNVLTTAYYAMKRQLEGTQ